MATTQMIPSSEVNLCVDTLIVETVLGDPKLYKKAGVINDLLSKIKEYFMAHIDKEHPVASVLKMLAPGALWVLMQGIGLGKWGLFLGLLTDYLHVDIPGMIGSMLSKVKDLVSGGKQASSSQIDAITQQVAQEHSSDSSPAADHKVYTSLELLEEAKFMRLALIEYEHQKLRLTKEGTDVNNLLGFGGAKAKSTSLLAKIIGWIFKIAFASAGLMVAGDAVHAFMGEPSALTGTYQEGKTPTDSETPATPSGPVSTQTKFKLKSDAPLPSTWSMVNNLGNIENMVVQVAKDTYNGLDGKDGIIRNTAGFKAITDNIAWYNVHNQGSAVTFIPGNFGTKKHLVDYFIDDVAAASP